MLRPLIKLRLWGIYGGVSKGRWNTRGLFRGHFVTDIRESVVIGISTAYLLSVDVLLNLGQFEPFSYSIHMLSIDILVVLVYFASFQ